MVNYLLKKKIAIKIIFLSKKRGKTQVVSANTTATNIHCCTNEMKSATKE